VCGLYSQTDRCGKVDSDFVVCTDRLTYMVNVVVVRRLYRHTDRYGEYGRWFVECTDRLTDMANVVVCFGVVHTD
jgi:hypothetical protein